MTNRCWRCHWFLGIPFSICSTKPNLVYSKITFIPKEFHNIIPLLLVIPVGLWNPYILGGSHDFIKYVTNMSLSTNWKAMVAILLVTEMVGSVEQILPMTLITLVAYYVNRLLGGRPSLYDAMLEEN